MSQLINHAIDLPENVSEILEQDFWLLDHLNAQIAHTSKGPVKFSSTVSIFVRKGEAEAEINLMSVKVKAPCVVSILADQIFQIVSVSDDFDASFIVLSKRLIDNIFMAMKYSNVTTTLPRPKVVRIPADRVVRYERVYQQLHDIIDDKSNTYRYQALLFMLLQFYCSESEYLNRDVEATVGSTADQQNRLCERFLHLVQVQFRSHRFLDFYAQELGVSTKHLSRTVKRLTGFSAVEWIERYVVLEAKVMLKWSNMTIQQISDELNFPSQSFFGKYFKKNVGLSPKEFRNS